MAHTDTGPVARRRGSTALETVNPHSPLGSPRYGVLRPVSVCSKCRSAEVYAYRLRSQHELGLVVGTTNLELVESETTFHRTLLGMPNLTELELVESETTERLELVSYPKQLPTNLGKPNLIGSHARGSYRCARPDVWVCVRRRARAWVCGVCACR